MNQKTKTQIFSDTFFILSLLTIIFSVFYLMYKETTRKVIWEDRYQVISVTLDYKSSITRRQKSIITLQHKGQVTYWDEPEGEKITRYTDIEVREDVVPSIQEKLKKDIPLYFTQEEIEELRGRSNLGKAWDWLNKPR